MPSNTRHRMVNRPFSLGFSGFLNIKPSMPILVSPENDDVLEYSDFKVEFDWQTTSQTKYYEIQIATDSGFSNIVESSNTLTVSNYLSGVLNPDNQYFWRVRSIGNTLNSDWSATRNFILWYIVAKFTTDDSAPVASPYIADVGNLTLVQTTSEYSISLGKLNIPVGSGTGSGTHIRDTNSKSVGLLYLWQTNYDVVSNSTVSPLTGISNSSSVTFSAMIGSLGVGVSKLQYVPDFLVLLDNLSATTNYNQAALVTSGMIYMFHKVGTWRLVFVNRHSSSNLYAANLSRGGTTGKLDDLYIRKIVGFSDYTLATFTDTTLSDGDNWVGTADGITWFEFTLPVSPSAGDKVGVKTRKTADNYWFAYLERNAGNTAWDFDVKIVTNGTPATPSGWSKITGVGTPSTIGVIERAGQHRYYTKTTTWLGRGIEISDTTFSSQTGIEIESATGTTLTRVTHWDEINSVVDTEFSKGFFLI